MLEALTTAIVTPRPIASPQPRRRTRANSAVAARHNTTPDMAATPPVPRQPYTTANRTSDSHSQAIHGVPARENE